MHAKPHKFADSLYHTMIVFSTKSRNVIPARGCRARNPGILRAAEAGAIAFGRSVMLECAPVRMYQFHNGIFSETLFRSFYILCETMVPSNAARSSGAVMCGE